MLVYVGFIILTFAGSVLAGSKPPKHPEHSCPKNEHFTRNNRRCIRTCANKWAPISDDCKPFTGCVCNDGFVRLNDNGSGPCVPERKCPHKCKDPNAIYKKCPNPCPLSCHHPFPKICTKACIESGCECAPGFILDCNGKCIRPKDCPKPIHCPKHSHYVINDKQCPKTCGNRLLHNNDETCACVPFTGCACKPGYVRKYDNATGPCIKEEDCPNKCKDPNAIYKKCPNPCPLSCDHPFPKNCTKVCLKSGCECAPGFILDCNGKCIKPKDCPKPIICPEHSCYVINDKQCPKTCGNRLLPNNDETCDCPPFTGCACEPGYVRKYDNATGPCIKKEDCPNKCKDPNAIYKKCPNPCPLSCDHPFPKNCTKVCLKSGCECAPGFILDCNGKCIRPKDCPKPIICPKHSCYVINDKQCPKTCGNRLLPNNDETCDCPPFTGCACEPGYVRKYDNATGPCIKEEDCPPIPTCCGVNEVPTSCAIVCPPQTCDSIFSKYFCLPTECVPGCDCLNGYLRNDKGVCIRSEDCFKTDPNKCKDPNAIYKKCPNPCPLSCDHPFPKNCTKACIESGCECAPGFILDCNGKCIRPKDCPKPIICPEHSCYVINDKQCPKTCGNRLLPNNDEMCDCPPFTGCACEPGYVRKYDNATGPCIKEEDCPPIPTCCGVNEVPTSCAIVCPPQTCDSIFSKYYCPPTECVPGCDCLNDYLRNDKGVCIRSEDCFKTDPNKCKDPNAIYKKCPNPCPLSCDHPFPKNCTKACIESGCECAPGFILDCNGKCIRPKDCPKPIICPEHSCYVINDKQCPKTCGNRLLPNNDEMCDCPPFTGCACEPGYVRKYDNATGPCIKEEDCPPIPTCCGVNEVPTSCAIVCPPQTCDSIFSKYYCPPTECVPGCDCLNGYLRNDKGVCIRSEDCFKTHPIECNGPNEIYSDCAITCPPQTCESLFVTYLCAAEAVCATGCNCLDGYLRNSLGICVTIEECYNDPGGCNGDLNATRAHGCAKVNPPTCKNPEPKGTDVDVCVINGCQCKEGYIVCDDGNCIATKDCPGGSPNCGENKTYVDCKFNCPTNYCPVDDSRAQVACSLAYPCQGGCACKAGYLVVSPEDPRCVLASDCPEVKCTRPNEVWDPKPSGCFFERCEERDNECDYPYSSGPRCVCKEGYYRNEDDVCIPASKCPPLSCNGDYNATLTICPNPCPKTCDDPDAGDGGCIKICLKTNCQCKDGYFLTKKDGGICIKPEDCESCKGDPNAVYSYCPSACEPTCEKPDRDQGCTKQCMPPGCICRDGFVLNEDTGKCIKLEKCPKKGCGGDPNAVYSHCRSACEPTCDNPEPKICTHQCLKPGCVCKPGYVRSTCGKCIKPEACPGFGCNGDRNATYKECPSHCPLTCDDQDPNKVCRDKCAPSGCECNPGYVLTVIGVGGKCILPKDCPDKGCNGDLNATYSECPSYCPATCENLHSKEKVFCPAVCDPSGCVCKKGYVYTKKGGKCIKPEDCPVPCCKDPNAEYKECPSTCEPNCTNPDPKFCTKQCGCKGDPNAEYKECPSACEPTCSNPDPKFCTRQCMPPGCVCKKGLVLNENTGKCVEREKCPVPCCEDPNAEYKKCPSACEPTCKNPDPKICTLQCMPPGCVCKKGFVLNEVTGLCVERKKCPVPCCKDPNAEYKECPSACEPNCTNPDPKFCTKQCMPPGCVCKKGFVLNVVTGLCVERKNCPGCKGDPNAKYSECPSACEPTCSNPDPKICTLQCMPPGCVCKIGFVLNEATGKCVKREDCPDQCDGDRNATYVKSPSYCQATCENPDPEEQCMDMPMPPGCVCKHGFLRRKKGGKCVKPEDCPGGWPTCRQNETYVYCKVGCPNNYCPVDDSLAIIACDPMFPCPGGCVCQGGYLMYSVDDDRCILSSECPRVNCTRPNEVWDPHAPGCLHERCDDKDIPCDFPYPGPPRCRCIKGYYRNQDGICVPECECPKPGCNGDMNATFSKCPSKCPATCCNPDSDRICTTDCAKPGCVCNEGFMQSKPGGPCISPYDCDGGSPHCSDNMTYTSCKIDCPTKHCPQDENEVMVICDPIWPCPTGCECKEGYLMTNTGNKTCILAKDCPLVNCTRPNEVWDPSPSICHSDRCDEMYYECSDPTPGRPKCVCKPGYYRNKHGVCIPAKECPKSEPPICGYNEVAVPCRQICPPQNCEIAYTDYACTEESKICEPGCNCLPNHLRNGSGICIPNDQCPYPSTPVCGINEIARDCRRICPPQTCLSKYALFRCVEDLPCEPGCDCVPNYLRDEKGICIPSEKCPAPCEIPDECKRTCAKPNPPNCVYNPPKENLDGCDCKEGHILEKIGGKCIPIDQCPPDIACHGDPNARPKRCPKPCPSTCESPDEFPCKRKCEFIGCECKSGYILSNSTESARCILPDKCKGGNPCGKTGRFVDCKTDCQHDYCPVDDSRDLVFCDPPAEHCLSGCICNINYKRKSRADPRCIMSSKCPPVNCTRPNEEWCSCPSACLAENCEDKDNQPSVCNTLLLNCEPRCVCKKHHFRNSSGICVCAEHCPPGCGGDPNAKHSDCPSACPATCTNPDPKICTAQCMPPGCVCKDGFVLNEDTGKCVEREKCPVPVCKDPHAVYKKCPSACEPTCANPEPKVCTDQCMPPRCVCKKGYVLNEKNGKCVEKCDCPDH